MSTAEQGPACSPPLPRELLSISPQLLTQLGHCPDREARNADFFKDEVIQTNPKALTSGFELPAQVLPPARAAQLCQEFRRCPMRPAKLVRILPSWKASAIPSLRSALLHGSHHIKQTPARCGHAMSTHCSAPLRLWQCCVQKQV